MIEYEPIECPVPHCEGFVKLEDQGGCHAVCDYNHILEEQEDGATDVWHYVGVECPVPDCNGYLRDQGPSLPTCEFGHVLKVTEA